MNSCVSLGRGRERTGRGILVLALLGLACPAWAALGGNAASVQLDSVHLQGTVSRTSTARYKVEEIKTSAGQTVREFISAGGSVFGVAWEGPTTPDLRRLLGTYFEEFRQSSEQRQHQPRGPLLIETPNLVVQQSGHLRAFRGRAYLPAALPSGVQPSEIQ
jgi:Protein of unknown function (DUF2844)